MTASTTHVSAMPLTQGHTANNLNSMELPPEMIGHVVEHCFASGDITGIQALACTNKQFNESITMFVEAIKLEEFCPLLKMIDAEEAQKYGFPAVPTSFFPKLGVMKAYFAMASHIEGDAGVTYFNFTLPYDLTFRRIKAIAKGQGIKVEMETPQILSKIVDSPFEQKFPGMAANNVFKDSRQMSFDPALVNEYGCKLPTVQQYIIHIVLVQKIFNQCLFGKEPFTFGLASTFAQDVSLIVGASDSNSINISTCGGWDCENCGAGGWQTSKSLI